MDNGKSGGSDNIKAELLKYGGSNLYQWMTTVFNKIIESATIPSQWLHSNIALIHKKGSKDDINNYRPISLISNVYKVFAKCILQRMKHILRNSQSDEQAAFKSGFSTNDHLQSVNQIIEKSREYNIPMYFAFIDFKKAFDSVEHSVIWTALEVFGVPPSYITLLKNIYDNSTASIITEKTGRKFNIRRGVKQGDPISPILFTTVLEMIFSKLDWDRKGINIHGKNLTNLRFADDIILFSTNAEELQEMICALSNECSKCGLEANSDKTKLMTNTNKCPIFLNGSELEYVSSYQYLGQIVNFKGQDEEIEKRITNAWRKFWSLKNIFNMDISPTIRKHIFDSSVTPILTYGSQTWINTRSTTHKISVCQRSMERALLRISPASHTRNSYIREITKFEDAMEKAKKLKWNWAGHIYRLTDNRWTKSTTEWWPIDYKRNVGRPVTRWRDAIKKYCNNFNSICNDREMRKSLGKNFK